MVPLYRSRAPLMALAVVLLGTSCGGGGDGGVAPRVATTIQAAAPTSQEAPAGANVAQPPAVLIRDQNNTPMAGVSVTFIVTEGNGSVAPATVATGSDGIARANTWTLGVAPGTNVLTASAAGLPAVAFNATGIQTPTSVNPASPTTQLAAAGATVEAPAVIVFDGANNPMAGVTVTFTVTAGGGAVSPATVATGSDGIARATTWTLGATPANNAVTATVSGLTPVTFTVVVPASMAAATPTAQQAPATGQVSAPPAVVVRDAANNPVQGVFVSFTVTGGGGSITPGTVATGADGVARLTQWTLGATPGTNTVTASATALPTVTFTATGILIAASVIPLSQSEQDGVAGQPVVDPPRVLVRDQFSQPLVGANVAFAVTAGAGTIAPTSVATGNDGIAGVNSWVLGSTGINRATATVEGLAPLTFTANAAADPCASTQLTVGVPVNGTLGSGCVLQPGGEFVEFYQFTIAAQQAIRITQTSSQFDSYVTVFTPSGAVVAENDDIDFPSNVNSELFAILPAGTYLVGATSFDVGETGPFTLLVETTDANVTNCTPFFTLKNVSSQQTLSNSDCLVSGFHVDRFIVYLDQGESLTVDMLSTVVDSYLQLFDIDGNLLAENDNRAGGTLDARVVFTATSGSYYVVEASTAGAGATGAYRIDVQ